VDITILIAFVAGLLSFLSPCVLPLIPSYLSFVSGVQFQELTTGTGNRRLVFFRTLFFVFGFSIVFVVLGLLFSGPALLFSGATRWINLVAGLIVILLGFNIMFDLVATLNMEKRLHMGTRPASMAGAVVVGMAFGAGWSPCIGPILASILFLAGSTGETGRAALLLAVYSLGLGAPFLAAGLAFTRVSTYLNRIKKHFGTIKTISGLFLIAIGLLIALGRFQQINGVLATAGTGLTTWSEAVPRRADLVFGGIALTLALLHPVLRVVRRRPVLRPVGTTISVLLILLALSQFAGWFDLGPMIGSWLLFQGI